ncbi:peptidase T [Lachnoclostridium sp. An14]|uniref:peptidase T n=1 Tax=Lachnoclostridium sp. An14 TaxID=1965562 RepID=UPI000B3AB453|nr:peptidase T [Lachnoclostridium sp. An14]OUQ21828.1 peptidase T [Lachnoclostridium sp. An14]
MNATEKFLKYVTIDTRSEEGQEPVPSTNVQFDLANLLVEEMKAMGISDARVDGHCYVYGTIPATTDKAVPTLGFVAHMDTAPVVSGKGVNPRIVSCYDGGDILLNEAAGVVMSPVEFPRLKNYLGEDLIVTDGTTLLGADDKAGIAEIMAMAEHLLTHPEIPHGTIRLGFTPDEEVGRGTDFFDVAGFGADVAYTVDGGALGELEYENFNAASAKVYVKGSSIHPGSAKGKLKNAILLAYEFHSMLPPAERPEYTEGYEGFYHLNHMSGEVEDAFLDYLVRDHDREKFEEKKAYLTRVADYLNAKYGAGTVRLELTDRYYNMKEKILPHMYLVDLAKEAMEELSITPQVIPIRGGTDGCHLSYMGLPCPNLCTGGENSHGKYEFISVRSLEQTANLLVRIVEKFAAMGE